MNIFLLLFFFGLHGVMLLVAGIFYRRWREELCWKIFEYWLVAVFSFVNLMDWMWFSYIHLGAYDVDTVYFLGNYPVIVLLWGYAIGIRFHPQWISISQYVCSIVLLGFSLLLSFVTIYSQESKLLVTVLSYSIVLTAVGYLLFLWVGFDLWLWQQRQNKEKAKRLKSIFSLCQQQVRLALQTTLPKPMQDALATGLGMSLFIVEYHYLSRFPVFFYSTTIVYVLGIGYFRPQWARISQQMLLSTLLLGVLLQEIMILLTDGAYKYFNKLENLPPIIILNAISYLLLLRIRVHWDKKCLQKEMERQREERERQQKESESQKQEIERAKIIAKANQFQAQEWELQALRARIDPHFLNNALNDLNALIYTAPKQAVNYVTELADFFRDTCLFSKCKTVRLADELAQLRRYFNLRHLDLDNKLQERINAPESLLNYQVLPSSLLILVENALKHAFIQRPPPYAIVIAAEENATELILRVSDNGCGISPERLAKLGKERLESTRGRGGGVGLYSLSANLELVFDTTEARLNFNSSINGGTEVRIYQPKQRVDDVDTN